MRLAFATIFDSRDVAQWSGIPFYMAQAFQHLGIEIDRIGPLRYKPPLSFRLHRRLTRMLCNQRDSPLFNISAARHYSHHASMQLRTSNADAVIAPQIHPLCYLDSSIPIILWTDALYASLIGFYPELSSQSSRSIQQGNTITQECLSRCSLAIFSSDWAARTALDIYGVSKHKVKIVPFGANIEHRHTLDDIRGIVRSRSRNVLQLLFIGKDWTRKGGTIVLNVARALHAMGQPVELHIVGCSLPTDIAIPAHVKCHGFLSKQTFEGRNAIEQLLRESHFLFVPSRAEAYGIVFCEANAFGIPCLTSYVGGIATIVRDNVNGMTFALDSPVGAYCGYILELMHDYARYEDLARTAFGEFEARLDWKVAAAKVLELIGNVSAR